MAKTAVGAEQLLVHSFASVTRCSVDAPAPRVKNARSQAIRLPYAPIAFTSSFGRIARCGAAVARRITCESAPVSPGTPIRSDRAHRNSDLRILRSRRRSRPQARV